MSLISAQAPIEAARAGGHGAARCFTALLAAGADWVGPNMILDDGGDATILVHKGREFELAGAVPAPTQADTAEWRVVLETLRTSLQASADRWTRIGADILGVTEETTTGVHRLYELAKSGALMFAAIIVNEMPMIATWTLVIVAPFGVSVR